MLSSYLRKRVSVVTVDGRNLVGILWSADQLFNIVLSEAIERVAAPSDSDYFVSDGSDGVEEEQVGTWMGRGTDIVSIGLVDVFKEAQEVVSSWRGRDIPPSSALAA
ncbi:U6 snRNA-associated Sm-like protein LSm8 [Angomonas deanei]|uniref:LSM domain containing protein, putative n=1 Tax=Angomonas deanei TaxID=59799 RepID=S9VIT5_9TRYP|nr:U6 snRNA-associated Sm-like protein LSm8 [Angomonas deanei]EPY42697.1 U6 snRNA-associated Sm-like protein LSm8 [Angomonas deanei]CAD2222997.1 LSM domain containing protein, putative [Angomonas deanei]|eukprot:EPY41946.1 U6 snRNA-associated Sm-like protein LSm8 [Angomonas deanei]